MQIQINTDHNINGHERIIEGMEASIRGTLDRFSSKLTRIEAHLKDQNSDQKDGGADKRCLLEARPAGLKPVAVTHDAPTIELALDGAVQKLERALDTLMGKLADR